jgi:hypothetical protein
MVMHAKMVLGGLRALARAGGDLAAGYGGWPKAGIRLENPARPEPELSHTASSQIAARRRSVEEGQSKQPEVCRL